MTLPPMVGRPALRVVRGRTVVTDQLPVALSGDEHADRDPGAQQREDERQPAGEQDRSHSCHRGSCRASTTDPAPRRGRSSGRWRPGRDTRRSAGRRPGLVSPAGRRWQHEREPGAADRRVADLEAAAVGGGHVGRDGQAEAGAAGVAGAPSSRRTNRLTTSARRPAGCRARRRRRRRDLPGVGRHRDAHARGWRGGRRWLTRWSRARPTAPASPTTGSTSSPTARRPAPGAAARRPRATVSTIEIGVRASARSSPRASSSRSSTRPCSRSSSSEQHVAGRVPVGARRAPGDLQLGAHHGDRRAQLVRGVGHQAPARRRAPSRAAPACRSSSAPARRSRPRRRHRHPLVQRVASRSPRPGT